MNETLKKFSEELVNEFKAALERQETDEVIAKTEADAEGQEFKFVVSTSSLDRQGDEIDQSKWDFTNYKKNPVVLWAHDYYSPPIGICTDIKTEGEKTIATVKFAPASANPFAAQVASLVQEGYINATSVGYIEHDNGTNELLEFSIVPIPANAQALSIREAEKMGLNVPQLVMKGITFETKGAIPYADHGKADPDTAWDGPAQVKECGDDFKKLKAICAWYDAENPDVKSSYKLPHHQASDLKAVWRGVTAAMGALLGARGGTKIPEKDKKAVYSHLAKHYKEFDKEAPEFEKALELAEQHLKGETVEEKYLDFVSVIEKAEQVGDKCEMDDGTPGVLAEDPDNPGKLVCIPPDESKKSEENNGDEPADPPTPEEGGEEKKGLVTDIVMQGADDREKNERINYILTVFYAFANAYYESPKESFFTLLEEAIELIQEYAKQEREESDANEVAEGKALKGIVAKFLEEGHTKAGRAISAKNKEKIKAIIEDAESHHTKQIAALKDLVGPDAGSEGEEQEGEKSLPAPKPKVEVRDIRSAGETFEGFMATRRVLRTVDKAVGQALEDLNQKFREQFPNRR